MVAPILFILFLNFFALSLVLASLREGKPAIISMLFERSKGVAITRRDHPFWYWIITANYIISAIGLALSTPSMIRQILAH